MMDLVVSRQGPSPSLAGNQPDRARSARSDRWHSGQILSPLADVPLRGRPSAAAPKSVSASSPVRRREADVLVIARRGGIRGSEFPTQGRTQFEVLFLASAD